MHVLRMWMAGKTGPGYCVHIHNFCVYIHNDYDIELNKVLEPVPIKG
jgi:hypothetical protein